MQKIDEINHEGYKIEIIVDEMPEDPRRAWDNLGTMVCKHQRYRLGDDRVSLEEAQEEIKGAKNKVVVLALYLYDHSGITIRTHSFSDGWDSGQVGFIYVTYERIKEEYGQVDETSLKNARDVLEDEVRTYDHYLTGEVYGYRILDAQGDVVDSCYGYYGYENKKMLIDECKAIVDKLPTQYNFSVAISTVTRFATEATC